MLWRKSLGFGLDALHSQPTESLNNHILSSQVTLESRLYATAIVCESFLPLKRCENDQGGWYDRQMAYDIWTVGLSIILMSIIHGRCCRDFAAPAWLVVGALGQAQVDFHETVCLDATVLDQMFLTLNLCACIQGA